MEPTAKAILETVGSLGYVVQIGGAWGRVKITATGDDGETFVVGGDDLYAVACELAEQVGIGLKGKIDVQRPASERGVDRPGAGA